MKRQPRRQAPIRRPPVQVRQPPREDNLFDIFDFTGRVLDSMGNEAYDLV